MHLPKLALKLLFVIRTSYPFQDLEFLHVLHKAATNSSFGFTTKHYIKNKKTAVDRTFIHGQSHHPKHIYKSTVLSESMRLRRLCEENADYLEGLEQVAYECEKLYQSIISNARTWTNRFNPTNRARPMNKSGKKIAWPTSFPNITKLTEKEKRLQPNAFVSYRRPAALEKMLTNYKKLAEKSTSESEYGISGLCRKRALCDNHGNHASMVTVDGST